MHTMNITEQERIALDELCHNHIDLSELYCKPLNANQEYTLKVIKAFVRKLGNLNK